MPLTDDAKKEIAEAIAIVRGDRFEKYARERLAHMSKPADPVDPPPKDPVFDPEKDPKDPIVPPPPKPNDPPPTDPPKGRRSAYWGEILDE
jgi:hypothetical protein